MYVRNFVKRPQYLYHLIFMYLTSQTWIYAENDVIGFLLFQNVKSSQEMQMG